MKDEIALKYGRHLHTFGGYQDQDIQLLKSALTEFEERLREEDNGHGKPCYYCGLQCSSLSGNPGMWPIVLSHSDEPGVPKYHHMACVNQRLIERDSLKQKLDLAVKAFEEIKSTRSSSLAMKAWNKCTDIAEQTLTTLQQ